MLHLFVNLIFMDSIKCVQAMKGIFLRIITSEEKNRTVYLNIDNCCLLSKGRMLPRLNPPKKIAQETKN